MFKRIERILAAFDRGELGERALAWELFELEWAAVIASA